MKKLLTIATTMVLISGSLINATAFSQINHQKTKREQNPPPEVKATNEDAEDIASKLFHKTIKLDPNVWLGKNLATNQADFNKTLVKLGILSASETQYVTWSKLDIKVAGWYWSEAFTVKKDGATATGNVAINASTGETPAEIAAKLSKAKIQFNYDWWKGKSLKDNWAQIPQIIANEHLLTKAEASVVTGLASYKTISGTGQFAVQMHVNDGNTDYIATPHINVVNDGLSDDEIATKISGGTFYLKGDARDEYADSNLVTKEFKHYLVNDSPLFNPSFTEQDADAVLLPHVQLSKPKTKLTATVSKDGQIKTSSITITAYLVPRNIPQYQSNSRFGLVVNLTPIVVDDLKGYFQSQSDEQSRLEYFYNTLDNFKDSSFPSTEGLTDFKPSEILENLMGSYGNAAFTVEETMRYQAKTSDSGNEHFAKALYNDIMKVPFSSYQTVFFDIMPIVPFTSMKILLNIEVFDKINPIVPFTSMKILLNIEVFDKINQRGKLRRHLVF